MVLPREICTSPPTIAPTSTTNCSARTAGTRTPTMTLTKPSKRSTVAAPIKPSKASVRLCRVVCGGPRNMKVKIANASG